MENSSFYFDLQEIVSAFMVLFAVAFDVTGLLPVFIDFQNKGMKISPIKAAIYSLIAFVAFLCCRQWHFDSYFRSIYPRLPSPVLW